MFVCVSHSSAGTHVQFIKLLYESVNLFHETQMFSSSLTHPQSSGASDIGQSPWSQIRAAEAQAVESKQNRHPPGPNAYILLRRRVALETRRRLHGRSAEKMRIFNLPASCEGGIVYVDHVIEWKKRAGACLTVYARFPNQRLGVAQWEPKARRNGHEKPWMISSSLRTTNDIWNIVEEVLYLSHWEML